MRARIAADRVATVRHFVDAGDEVEVFEHGQVVVEAEALRHVADLAADFVRLARRCRSRGTAPNPPSGFEQAAEHADRRRLAAAVGPEKAADFALATCRLRPSTTLRSPKLLRRSADVDGVVAHGARVIDFAVIDFTVIGFTVTGWPGLSEPGLRGRRPGLGKEHELAARLLGIDEGRGVFGLRGDERDRSAEIGRAIVAGKRDLVADMHPRELRLGDEEAHEDVLGRQKRDDRRAGCERFTGEGDDVGDDAGVRSNDRPLIEPPLGLLQRRLERIDHRLLRLNLRRPPHRRLSRRERGGRRRDLGLRRSKRRLFLIDSLLGRRTRFEQRGAPAQILLRPVARRFRVAKIGLRLFDLGRFGGRQQIGQLVARLLQEPARLIDRRTVVGGVLFEQRLALCHPVAARDIDGG